MNREERRLPNYIAKSVIKENNENSEYKRGTHNQGR